MYTFKFADVGEGIHEGKVTEIFVKEGDSVKDGTDMFLVETDKFTTEVASPVKGVISKVLVKVGDVVHVGQPMFEINTDVADTTTTTTATVATPKVDEPTLVKTETKTDVKEDESQKGASVVGEIKVSNNILPLFGMNAKTAATQTSNDLFKKTIAEISESIATKSADVKPFEVKTQEKYVNTNVTASPLARMIAKEKGIDLTTVKGTGPLGRILVADLQNLEKPTSTSSAELHAQVDFVVNPITKGFAEPQPTDGSQVQKVVEHANHAPVETKTEVKTEVKTESGDSKVEMTSIRKAIAHAMKESWSNVAYTNLSIEVDVTELWDQRNKVKEHLFRKEGVKLNLLPFIVKAIAKATKVFPNFNAIIDDKTNTLVVKKQVNMGIAVDTKDGLIVPNIKDVNSLSIIEISKQISVLAAKARDKKVQFADLAGGTISVTNYGSLGVNFGVPVIKYPEVAIVGIGSLETKFKKVGPPHLGPHLPPHMIERHMLERKVIYLTMAADHRWVDGADIARFLSLVKEYLENITLLFV